MRILILGNNYSTKVFFDLFSKNKDDIVFCDNPNCTNAVFFNDFTDIIEFCSANIIDFVLIIDNNYIIQGLGELLSSKNISVFSPDKDAALITTSKFEAKKFAYKNRIKTPKFTIAQNPKQALDYIKASTVVAIKPDIATALEGTKFIETYSYGLKIINELFQGGNERVLLEDYIEGKSFTIWTLTDGYSAKIIGVNATYGDSISLFNPDFINEETKEKIINSIVNPTINALVEKNNEYIGVLGFDCIIDRYSNIYLLSYKNFFDDHSVNYFPEAYDFSWIDVFNSIVLGDVFLKYKFNPQTLYALTIKQGDSIDFITAKTKNALEKKLIELDYELDEFYEAKKKWKN